MAASSPINDPDPLALARALRPSIAAADGSLEQRVLALEQEIIRLRAERDAPQGPTVWDEFKAAVSEGTERLITTEMPGIQEDNKVVSWVGGFAARAALIALLQWVRDPEAKRALESIWQSLEEEG